MNVLVHVERKWVSLEFRKFLMARSKISLVKSPCVHVSLGWGTVACAGSKCPDNKKNDVQNNNLMTKL